MVFELYVNNYFFSWVGFNHYVEILQSYVFFSLIYTSCLVLLLN